MSKNIINPDETIVHRWLSFKSKYLTFIACSLVLIVGYTIYVRTWWSSWGVDWHETFYPATRLLIAGQNPYAITILHNPFWALLPLVPFALLGEKAGQVAYLAFNFFSYAFVAYKLRAKPIAWTAFLLSLPVLQAMRVLNVDALVLWGYILPVPVGLFFVLTKPQIGIAIVIYWSFIAWREGGLKKLAVTFTPVSVALLLSFAMFGNWLTGKTDNLLSSRWNTSLWPWSIPLGIALLYLGLKYRKDKMAISASPMLSPYVTAHSWSIAFIGLLENDLFMIGAVVCLWVLFFLAGGWPI